MGAEMIEKVAAMSRKRIHKARFQKDVNVIRAILLNINDQIKSDHLDQECSEQRYKALVAALMEASVIRKIDGTDELSTDCFVIADPERFNQWSKSSLYRCIEKYIIPFLGKN